MTPDHDPFAYLRPFAVWENAFTPAELDTIEALGDRLRLERASVTYEAGDAAGNDPQRITRTAWLERSPETAWLYERMERVARLLNSQVYRFELSGFSDLFQYTVYDGAEGSHFGWHVDQVRQASHRKLSLSLQLTDPALYQGCDLEIHAGSQTIAAPRTRGALIAFPAYMLHRVTPIVSGTRKALVVWTAGPPFR
jgi:PKHD-type hydroxylase